MCSAYGVWGKLIIKTRLRSLWIFSCEMVTVRQRPCPDFTERA